MDKRNKVLLIALCVVIVAGIGVYVVLSSRTMQAYIDSGATVLVHNQIYGAQQLEAFFEDEAPEAALRFVAYSVEGDPVVYDILYIEGWYEITVDSSRDRYGAAGQQTYRFAQRGVLVEGQMTYYYFFNDDEDDDKLYLPGIDSQIVRR